MMKKILIVIFFMFELCSLVACSNRPKTENDNNNVKVESEGSIDNTDTVETPSIKYFDCNGQIFSTKSEDGNVIINVITKKFTHENEIVEISIIVNGVTLNTIDNVVGYFSSVVFDTNSSLAIINYRGRMWSNFMLLDINTGQVIYYEPFCFADVIPLYQNKNMMNYEININDVMVFSCDKILDRDSIIFSYQVHDTNGYLQSGTFKYIISSQTFLDLQENEPEQEG